MGNAKFITTSKISTTDSNK